MLVDEILNSSKSIIIIPNHVISTNFNPINAKTISKESPERVDKEYQISFHFTINLCVITRLKNILFQTF